MRTIVKNGCLLMSLFMLTGLRAHAEDGVTDTEIVLGTHSPQTGVFSHYGVTVRVMKAYFDSINEKGGINGRKIKFLIEDSAFNAQQALQVTKKLVEKDKVFAIVTAGGAPHLAVYQYLRSKKVPDLWIFDPSTPFTVPAFKSTFGFSPHLTDDAKMTAEYLVKKWSGKKMGIIGGDLGFMKEATEVMKKDINGKLNILPVQEVAMSATNGDSQILNLKKENPDVVWINAQGPIVPKILKFANEQGFHPQWILMYGNANSLVLNLAPKEATNGAISSYYLYNETDTDLPGIKEHLALLKARLPHEKPSALTIVGQAQAEAVVATLEKAGKNLTRENAIKAAEEFKDWKCTVCRASVSTSPTQHVLMAGLVPLVAHDGKWMPLLEK